MEFADLLAAVGDRKGTGLGIELASWYATAIGPCLAADGCQQKFFGLGTEEQWAAEIKAAASRLVYRNPDMEPDGGLVLVQGGEPRPVNGQKAKPDFPVTALTDGSCMDFTGVATSKSKDRDADVLDPAGADPDEQHPLLWQHLQLCPIGRHVQVLGRGPDQIRSHWAIADTQLGNDAALLVEFKALRLSIGFIPLEFEPLEKSGLKVDLKKDPRLGWYVKRYKWVETSLVSIPSNEDATITAFSRNKLSHPLVKAWAQGLLDLLPDMVRSGWELPHDGHDEPPAKTPAAVAEKPGCGCGKPAAGCACRARPGSEDGKKKDGEATPPATQTPEKAVAAKQAGEVLAHRRGIPSPHLENSWEQIQASLENGCGEHMKQHGMRDSYGHTLLGTFDKHVVVASEAGGYYGNQPKYKVHKIAWKMGKQGPEFDGAPEAINLVLTHTGEPGEKKSPDLSADQAIGLLVKAARMGKRDRLTLKLGEAEELAGHVKDAPELKAPTRASALRLHGLVVDSLTDVKTQDGKPVEQQGTNTGENTTGRKQVTASGPDEIEAFFAELMG